jgi:hypothetical protein
VESILKEVNAILGVSGTFVCLPDGSIAAQAMPEKYTADHLNVAARVASQTFQALDLSGQPVAEADLLFGNGRLILKNFRGGILVILCARNINAPLLNLTANVAVKKLVTEIRASHAATPIPTAAKPTASTQPPAPAPPSPPVPVAAAPTIPAAAVELPPLVNELQEQAQQIINAASNKVSLWVMDPVALWQHCHRYRHLLTVPHQRQIEFAGYSEQLSSIVRLFGRLGYQNTTRAQAPAPIRSLTFSEPKKSITTTVFLDTFAMYHRLDFKPFLKSNEPFVPVTALTLIRLQLVEIPDEALSDLAALFIEYDVSTVPKENHIDVSQITLLCADDWGWYKTVSMNLEQLILFVENSLLPAERNIVIERARRLKNSLDGAPKSLRWQARARLGESVRWYETPAESSAPPHPETAIG